MTFVPIVLRCLYDICVHNIEVACMTFRLVACMTFVSIVMKCLYDIGVDNIEEACMTFRLVV